MNKKNQLKKVAYDHINKDSSATLLAKDAQGRKDHGTRISNLAVMSRVQPVCSASNKYTQRTL